MAEYQVELTHKAVKQFLELGATVQERIRARIDALADDPRPHRCEKLEGMKSSYRIRVGDYRIVYAVSDELRTVEVVRIANRRDVYKRL
ncbi:MAG TPA: type II toxin-antitoxin system RelE/ParE family toxin [Actinomycetota bacterium]|nr:type II toxin-antitoxin system RelE/ParE family toxin [Actinomycetota bacterium]